MKNDVLVIKFIILQLFTKSTSRSDSRTMMIHLLLQILVSLLLAKSLNAGGCDSPKFSTSGYSTQDGFFHYKTTYILEFSLQCSNNYQQDGTFYALVAGKVYQVAVSEETSKYQVSWQVEHADSGAQTFDVHIYDEDKMTEYKKVEQSGGDPRASVSPLFTAQYYHPGVSRKSPISSESVCLLLGAAAAYFALIFKQRLAKRD